MGKQKKTGPKPQYGKPMDKYTIMLPDHLEVKAYQIGDGLSDGIRKALEAYDESPMKRTGGAEE